MRTLDRALRRLDRLVTVGPPARRARSRPVPADPGARSSRPSLTVGGIAIAIGSAVVVGLVLVPFRDELEQSVSLLMVLPVVLVALVAGLWPAVIAAVAAACVFNVLHTEPYGTLRIDDPDDIVEMLVLLAVGAAIGVVVKAAQRAVVSAGVRHRELEALTRFLDAVGRDDREHLIESGRHAIASVLAAREATWRRGYRGTAAPVLDARGALVSIGDVRSGGPTLPPQIEIPVGTPPHEHGRFVVASSDADVSAEERTAAAAIAAALGRLLDAAQPSDR